MYPRNIVSVLALALTAAAQRPSNTSICDFYTTALLKDNTAENQYTLLTLLVNTAVIGNYTMPNVGVSVPGILAKGNFNGVDVNLLPYFNGMLVSSNRNNVPTAVNFLDGGGADPLKKNMPANDKTSNQYFLLTHLYSFFGAVLGCTHYNNPGSAFPAYTGASSQYNVHKFMDLSAAEFGYFVQQVAMSGASFGVSKDDLTVAGTALNSLFGQRCAPAAEVIPGTGTSLQAICIESTCPTPTAGAVCAQYDTAVRPATATATTTTSTGTATGTATTTMSSGTGGSATGGSMTTRSSTAGGAVPTAAAMGVAAVAGGFAAMLL